MASPFTSHRLDPASLSWLMDQKMQTVRVILLAVADTIKPYLKI
jgi:hypothetical protein